MNSGYFESKPVKLSNSIFNLYQYIVIDLNKSSGIIVEDACREFMFVKQANVFIKINGHAPVRIPQAFSVGKIKAPFRYQYSGKIDYFAVKLQPWVGNHFFPADTVNDVIDLNPLYGSGIEALRTEIFDSKRFEEMIARVETFFLKIEMPDPAGFRLAQEIAGKIYSSKGMISVGELVKEFSESRQKLNQDFLYHTKYSIKEFAVFVKIRAAIKFKQEHPDISLTELAHHFGYFDQSHFNRDIKRVTSVTPTFLFSNKNFIKEQLKKSPA